MRKRFGDIYLERQTGGNVEVKYKTKEGEDFQTLILQRADLADLGQTLWAMAPGYNERIALGGSVILELGGDQGGDANSWPLRASLAEKELAICQARIRALEEDLETPRRIAANQLALAKDCVQTLARIFK